MTISDLSLKKLWALSGGICSFPECDEDCVKLLTNESYVVGEMAHVIAVSPSGPRGIPAGGSDDYENLILLCPTHHTMIDKSPEGTYSKEEIHLWKRNHENKIRERLKAPKVITKNELFNIIKKYLIENKHYWQNYGPESQAAKDNPFSNVAEYWDYIKLQKIIPNNQRITNLIKSNSDLLTSDEYSISYEFILHSEGFEKNAFIRTENIPRFPIRFQELIYE